MKKTLALFGLTALTVAAVVLTAVHGQNNNASKFRRQRAEKRINNQYIVVLKDGIADRPPAVAADHRARLAVTVGHIYQHALRGYAARLSSAR